MKQKRLFYISGGGYIASSLAVLLMSCGDLTGQNGSKAVAVFSAVLFWLSLFIAVTAQMLLRRMQKPYRKRGSPIANMLSPPTFWMAMVFVISLIATIILSIININGFILYLCICITLLSAEWMVLTSGKFRRKDGKLVLKIYKKNQLQGGTQNGKNTGNSNNDFARRNRIT